MEQKKGGRLSKNSSHDVLKEPRRFKDTILPLAEDGSRHSQAAKEPQKAKVARMRAGFVVPRSGADGELRTRKTGQKPDRQNLLHPKPAQNPQQKHARKP
jgi:hypothetical protein